MLEILQYSTSSAIIIAISVRVNKQFINSPETKWLRLICKGLTRLQKFSKSLRSSRIQMFNSQSLQFQELDRSWFVLPKK